MRHFGQKKRALTGWIFMELMGISLRSLCLAMQINELMNLAAHLKAE